jgi:hypothetical protein
MGSGHELVTFSGTVSFVYWLVEGGRWQVVLTSRLESNLFISIFKGCPDNETLESCFIAAPRTAQNMLEFNIRVSAVG